MLPSRVTAHYDRLVFVGVLHLVAFAVVAKSDLIVFATGVTNSEMISDEHYMSLVIPLGADIWGAGCGL